MTGTHAGRSAQEIARRHREKIARLERSAARWEAGAAGERAVAEVLDQLTACGWTVMHDVPWPGRAKANIDHVVVGPGGVFVIDAKNWSGTVQVRDDVLRQNGHSRESDVARVGESAVAVLALVPDVPVHAVMCLVGDEPRRGWVRDVMICSTSTLLEMVLSRPPALSPADVGRVSHVLGVRLTRTAVTRRQVDATEAPGSRSRKSRRKSGPSLARLLGFLVIVGLLVVMLRDDVLSSVGDYVADVVMSESDSSPLVPEDDGGSRQKQRGDRQQ